MSIAAIHSILDTQLKQIANIPPLMLENTVFDATQNKTAFIRSTLLPATSAVNTIGVGAQKKMQGLYQVDVFTPTGSGHTSGQTWADTIVGAYSIGLRLTDNTYTVLIEISSVLPAYEVNKYYAIPVQVQWTCYV